MRRHRGMLAIVGGLALIVSAPTQAGGPRLPGGTSVSLAGTPFTVTTNGATPDIAVDEEGSAHIVWNEIAPQGSADVLHYCKVLRRGSSCAIERTFVPPDGEPNFNRDFGRPRVVLPSPDEVMVFTPRYPNGVNVDDKGNLGTCDGTFNDPGEVCYTSSRKTYVYRSFDGGESFGAARVFSHVAPSGDMAVLHPPGATPIVALVTETTTGGTFFAAAPTDGYERREINFGDEGDNRAYNGTIGVLEDDKAVVAFEDLDHNVYVRGHFDPSAPLMDLATWGPSLTIKGSEPRLAGGPGGVYLLYKPRVGTADRPYTLRRLNASGVVGPAVRIGDTAQDRNRDLFEDESGRVHAAWVRRGPTSEQLRYRSSPDGTNFSAPVTLASGSSINHVALGAADDGGGFAVYDSAFLANGTITVVPFGSQAPRTLIDVSVAGVEVTQGIQTPTFPTRSPDPAKPAVFAYGGVKLAALHSTVVRVYANSRRPLSGLAVPPMALRGFKDGRPLGGGALLPDRVPTALPVAAPSAVADAERLSTTTVYTFTLPWQWAQGSVELQLEINPTSLTPVIPECRLCRGDNTFRLTGLAFQPTARVRFQPVAVTVNGRNPRGYPDPQPLFRPARETSPLPFDLPDYRGTIDMSDLANATEVEVESCFLGVWPCDSERRPITQSERLGFALDRLHDWAADKSSSTFPIGVFRDGSTLGGVTVGGGQLFGARQPYALARDSRPLTSLAHEIGHGLGRVHAGLTCGSNSDGQVGEAWPPNDDGALDGRGLDLTKPSPYAVLDPAVPGAPATYFDFMSYCANTNETTAGGNVPDAWKSIRNWEREIGLNAPAGRRAAGRPRFVARIAATQPRQASSLRVVAVVPVDGKPTIAGVAPDAGGATPVDPASPYTFVARDGTGKELATAGGVAEVEHVEGELPVTIVTGRVPGAGAASIELVRDGAAVAQQVASRAAPKLRIVSPRRGERAGRGGTVTLRWRATDADGDPLKAIVEYSSDNGRTFSTVAIGPNENRFRLRSALLSASRRARVRVRIQDGFHETIATSPRFTALGAPPRVRISAPAPGTTIAAGAAVTLRGEAFDDSGRSLSGKALTWLVGKRVVARGALVSVAGLGAGTRKLVLRARDRSGRAGTTSTTIEVTPRTPQFTVLKGPKALSRKARKVVLRVASTFESRLRVGRTRATVGRRPKRVTVRLKPGRSLLQLGLTLSSGRLTSGHVLEIPRR